MSDSSRRAFLKTAGSAALTAASYSRVLGANERVHVGIVGLGGRGQDHLKTYLGLPATSRITGLCDVNQAALERAQVLVKKTSGDDAKGFEDMRKMFDDKNIDAVSMPLPNHWHALATIWACQAGKDVYIEKPASYNIFEGIKMVEAARKYKRMVQIGSQSRSVPHFQQAAKLLNEGAVGKLYMAKGVVFKRRKSIGHKEDEPVPAGVNWDLFLGPAPMRPYNELRFKYNWHWFWDTGNGDIGNQGVHQMDIARWGMGDITMPKTVVSTGGKFAYIDDQETPNTQFVTLDYGNDKQIQFEVRGLLTGDEGGLVRRGGNVIGNLYWGTDGWMSLDGSGFTIYKGESNEKSMEFKVPGRDNSNALHMTNFLDCCKSRDHTKLTADVEVGAHSAALCHLGNISYRVGRKLQFDSAKMKFVNDSEADKLLTRVPYRKGFVVPEKV
jgi:predicted dehydrogenase